nr:DUF420 domain-containing protein [Bacteroidota bacterium]
MESTFQANLPAADLKRDDKKAAILIWIVSVVVFIAVALLAEIKIRVNLPFNPHVFATANAIINSIVAMLLVAALMAVKSKKFYLHKRIMILAIILSLLFLISYI